MSETQNAAPNGEPNPADATTALPAAVGAADLVALDGHAPPTDDTPTIISRAGPHPPREEPPGGLRGRILAHFELIEPIGVGGMAAVIRARDTQLDRLVALKILPPDMAKDPENVRRFHQEARSAARLDHENIARVFFCGEDQNLHFIAFEFVEGDNLRAILERRGRLPAAEALHYVLQVAAGLAHAAQRGVVHRDIKPSNIIITPAGRAKLVDMGLARSLERQDDQGLTQSGVTLGTFDYISPEQALEPREADVRSDIYSLGCTLYHVLTGHPPVPDGTAAKKLHHHQHIKPRDPREVVPGLPDEVAVILDRMMAKRPQDRYQSPEQLVHHLLLAARKLGGPSNVPEGVLSVEAALPPPPGGRPLLLAALAAGLVVLAIVALELFNRPAPAPTSGPQVVSPQGPPQSDEAGPKLVNTQTGGAKPPGDGALTAPAPPQPVAVAHYDGDGRNLLDWLKTTDRNAPKEIVLSGDVNLRLPQAPLKGDAGLTLTGPRVTIQAKSGRRPTIRFTHDSDPQAGNPWVGVSIDSPNVVIDGVRFLVDGRASDVRMAALRLHAPAGTSATFTVENCEFIQVRPGTGEKRLASLDAASDGTAAKLELKGCRFLSFRGIDSEGLDTEALLNDGPFGGDDAVRREGPIEIQADNCAFGPHGVLFRLEGGKDEIAAPALTLNHCSVLAAGPSVVFDVGRDATVDLSAQASLFAEATRLAGTGGFVLVRQADRGGVTFADSDNRYFGLDAFRVVGDDRQSWTSFENWAAPDVRTSSVLRESPWKTADPLQPLRRYAFKDEPEDRFAAAFQIKPSREARPDLRLGTDKTAPVGVRTLGGVDYVKVLREADKAADLALQKRRIVDPNKDDSANRVYKTLEQALAAAEPGDEILLRWDGIQRVAPIRLDKKTPQDVTIRPEENRHPQILLTAGQDAEPALFRVYDGKLRLEGLELILRPEGDYRRQALIDLVGQGQCSLKNCLATLDRAAQPNTRLAVLWLSDPAKAMMQPTRPLDQTAQLTLDGCFVRGDGDLVACPMSRPFTLEATGTLAALKGSFLCVDAGSPAAPTAVDPMTVLLKKVTTYLGGNLVRLRTKDSLTPVHCTATDCLFVGAAKEPLVQVNESDLSQVLEDKDLGRLLTWTGGGRIEYGNYDMMLEQTPPQGEMAPMPIGAARWESVWGNNTGDKQVKSFRWADPPPPTADDPFDTAKPEQFRPMDSADGCGADVDALERRLSPTAPK